MPAETPPSIRLRPATALDEALLLEWRNDEQTRQMSLDTRPVAASDHHRWLADALKDPGRRLFIAEVGGVAIGTTRLDHLPSAWSISITVAPQHRGAGHGGTLLRLTAEWFGAHLRGGVIAAAVKRTNRASLALFLRSGYVVAAEDAALIRLELRRDAAPPQGLGASPPINPPSSSS